MSRGVAMHCRKYPLLRALISLPVRGSTGPPNHVNSGTFSMVMMRLSRHLRLAVVGLVPAVCV